MLCGRCDIKLCTAKHLGSRRNFAQQRNMSRGLADRSGARVSNDLQAFTRAIRIAGLRIRRHLQRCANPLQQLPRWGRRARLIEKYRPGRSTASSSGQWADRPTGLVPGINREVQGGRLRPAVAREPSRCRAPAASRELTEKYRSMRFWPTADASCCSAPARPELTSAERPLFGIVTSPLGPTCYFVRPIDPRRGASCSPHSFSREYQLVSWQLTQPCRGAVRHRASLVIYKLPRPFHCTAAERRPPDVWFSRRKGRSPARRSDGPGRVCGARSADASHCRE